MHDGQTIGDEWLAPAAERVLRTDHALRLCGSGPATVVRLHYKLVPAR